jgi:hypothetical protein
MKKLEDETAADEIVHKDSNSLNLAGMSYIAGDVALAMAGEWGGAWWLAGGLVAARYGHPNADKQYELLSERLGNYLKRQGVQIPENPTTESLRKKGGVLDHVESFMYAYPSQILNTAYTIGSVLLIKNGLMPKAGKQKDYALASAGALVIAGALGGLLIKEKKPDPEHPPQGIVQKAWAWIQEKPLRWPAIAYGLNDVMLAKSTLNDMQRDPANKTKHYLKWITVATYAFGNVMLALSNKSHAGSHASVTALERLAETSAQVIAAQPKEVQEALLQQVSGYLAAQPESHLKAEEIATMLHKKLAEVSNKAVPADWQTRIQDKPANPLRPSI